MKIAAVFGAGLLGLRSTTGRVIRGLFPENTGDHLGKNLHHGVEHDPLINLRHQRKDDWLPMKGPMTNVSASW